MSYLKILTEEDYLKEIFEYPTIVYIKEADILKFSIPKGYNDLQMVDGIYQCADGDFYLLEDEL